MCLAIPGRIIDISPDGNSATVDFDGIKQNVIIALVQNAEKGKYVIVHAGYAIEIMNEDQAMEAISQWEEMSEELDLDLKDIV